MNLLDEAEELEGEDTKDDKTAFKPSEPISATPKSALPLYNEHKAFPFPAATSTPGTPAAPALPSSTPPQNHLQINHRLIWRNKNFIFR